MRDKQGEDANLPHSQNSELPLETDEDPELKE
jgi:hypothetical protein